MTDNEQIFRNLTLARQISLMHSYTEFRKNAKITV
jgi:hypothetical protein